MTWICLLVRDFAPTQERRLNPALSTDPLILIEAGAYRPKVIAADMLARHAGVKAGDWLGQARALCPEGQFLPVEVARYQRIFTDFTGQLLAITDRIEPEYQPTSAAWYTDDPLVLQYLVEKIHILTGIQPQIGCAVTRFPARVAAASALPDAPINVPEGQEASFLAPYPVNLLPLDKTMQRRLPLLGLDTLGQFASLPRIAIWEQFRKHGRWLHDLANGIDIRRLHPYQPPLSLRQQHSFEEPIADRQILHRVLEQRCLHLFEALKGQEARRVTLLLELSDGTVLEHQRQPHQPVVDNLYLLRLVTQLAEALPVSAPIASLEIRLDDIYQRMPVQLSLFNEKKPVKHLHDVVPEWAGRYRSTDFFRLALNGDEQLPERSVERRRVSAG